MDNRVPARNAEDVLSLRPIDWVLLDTATAAAQQSPRQRQILRFHELPEVLQRMVNAVEPGSYAQPHQHRDPDKAEIFVCLRGRAAVVRFDARGEILEWTLVAAGGPVLGVEIPPQAWHTLLALEPGTVLFEVKEGPYDAATDKRFAPWAPPESDTVMARAYLADLRRRLGLPPLGHEGAAPVEEEDDLC
jgi:cupin fold WbuC family metalloprotein